MIPKLNSAHGSDTRNIINRAIEVLNKQGIAIQDLVAEGQLTEEQYAELIRVVNSLVKSGEIDKFDLSTKLRLEIDDKRHKGTPINLNDFGSDVLSLIEGSSGNFNLLSIPRQGSVTPRSTNFIHTSTNLYNHKTTKEDTYLKYDDGTEAASSGGSAATDFISVEPYRIYSFFTDSSHSVFYYDETKNYISTEASDGKFTTPENAHYVRVVIRNQLINSFQVNEGDEVLDFEPYYNKLSDAIEVGNVIKPDNTTFITEGDEVFDGQYRDDLVNVNEGLVITSTENVYSALVRVEEGVTYSIKKGVGGNRFVVLGVTEIPDSAAPVDSTFYYRGENTGEEQELFFRNTNGAKYLFVLLAYRSEDLPDLSIKTGFRMKNLELEEGSVGYRHLAKELKSHFSEPKYFPPQDLTGSYTAKDREYTNMTLEELYTAFDELVADYPHVLSKEVLGLDESGEYEVWQMQLNAEEIESSGVKKKPKILLSGGVHGSEKPSSVGLYYMIKAICEDWRDSELLEYIRFNVNIIFIPVVSPYEYVNLKYSENYNGVDIQKNFPELWVETDPDGRNYSGPEPLSEAETRYYKSMLDSNTDAICFSELHASLGISYMEIMYHSLCHGKYGFDELEDISDYHIKKMTGEYIKNYNLPENEGYIGWINKYNSTGSTKIYGASKGIPSLVMETFYALPDEEYMSSKSLKAVSELLVNWLIVVISKYKQL